MTDEHLKDIRKKHHLVPVWLTKVLGSSFVLLAVAVLAVVGVSAFFGNKILKEQRELAATQEMLLSNLRVINEQTIVREIVEDKIKDSLSSEVKSRLAFEIYSSARRRNIPIHIVLGVIEKESAWQSKIRNNSGASGLFQVMPGTAIRYFRAKGDTFTLDKLLDPIINTNIGVDILGDYYDAAVITGRSNTGDFTAALKDYNGGGQDFPRQVMEKSVVFKKRLDTPLQK
jgi:soluble lytic murein transglycosylase-like protein